MPNPVSDSTTPFAWKPDFSFAFKDWIKGGVECLIWSFKGMYRCMTVAIVDAYYAYQQANIQ